MKVKSVAYTNIGKARETNQDNFYIGGYINRHSKRDLFKSVRATSREQVVAVCDGMGGEQDGEIASLYAVREISDYIKRCGSIIESFEEHTDILIKNANDLICRYMAERNIYSGTTVALLCINPKLNEGVGMNIGDSKIFMYRDNELRQISEDHNQLTSMIKGGIINENEAYLHKDKRALTQHLGIYESELIIQPFISDNIILKKGDMFLLCSDGLTDMVDNKTIRSIMADDNSIDKKARSLVNEALRNGGRDNITITLSYMI